MQAVGPKTPVLVTLKVKPGKKQAVIDLVNALMDYRPQESMMEIFHWKLFITIQRIPIMFMEIGLLMITIKNILIGDLTMMKVKWHNKLHRF